MLVIDGSDCVGKTTACRTACELSGWRYVHFDGPRDHPYPDHDGFIEVNQVQDRFDLSYLVYQEMMGLSRSFACTPEFIKLIQAALARAGSYVVVMYDSKANQLKSRLQKSDQRYDIETTLRSNNCWWLVGQSNLCHLQWDVATKGWPKKEDIAQWLLEAGWDGKTNQTD